MKKNAEKTENSECERCGGKVSQDKLTVLECWDCSGKLAVCPKCKEIIGSYKCQSCIDDWDYLTK